jgi:hypothetical protein
LVAGDEDVTIFWRPHHEVYPKLLAEQDFLAFVAGQERSIGRVYLMIHGPFACRWRWTMDARSHTGWVPFAIRGHEDSQDDAAQRMVEVYRMLLAHNERHSRKAPRAPVRLAEQSLPGQSQEGRPLRSSV